MLAMLNFSMQPLALPLRSSNTNEETFLSHAKCFQVASKSYLAFHFLNT